MHFTGVKEDERVAWGSWYQLIEAEAKIKTQFNDPIRAMFVKLKLYNPEKRKNKEEIPKRQKFEVNIGEYRVFYSEKK